LGRAIFFLGEIDVFLVTDYNASFVVAALVALGDPGSVNLSVSSA